MSSKKRSQVALEYMMVVAISLILVSGFSYYFFSQKTSYDEDAMRAKVNSIGDKVAQYAEEAQYSTGPYRKTLEVNVPESVEKIYGENKKYIIFETSDDETFVYNSNTPVFGYVQNSSVQSGEIIIEKVKSKAVVCGQSPCSCKDNESGYCNTNLDNDCDGLIDGADPDCCPDNDSDGFTDIDYDGDAPSWCQPPDTYAEDCNGNLSYVNPDEPERCNDIDHDCDGNVNNNNPCEFSCYVETPPEDGAGSCSGGSALLTVQSTYPLDPTAELHVEEPGSPTNNYQHDLCCNKVSRNVSWEWEVKNSCDGDEEPLLSFNNNLEGGSHVDYGTSSNYADTLCGDVTGLTGYSLSCRHTNVGNDCNADENQVATIKRTENSHLGGINEHRIKICCKVS